MSSLLDILNTVSNALKDDNWFDLEELDKSVADLHIRLTDPRWAIEDEAMRQECEKLVVAWAVKRYKDGPSKNISTDNMKDAFNPPLQRTVDDARRGDLDEKLKQVLDDAFATEPNGEVWLVEPVIQRIKLAFAEAGWYKPGESITVRNADTMAVEEYEARQSLSRKLDEAIMQTISIRSIDASEQEKVHPRWFTANGQMFTFDVDVEQIKSVLKDVARSGNNYGEFEGHLMTGQEWYDRFKEELSGIYPWSYIDGSHKYSRVLEAAKKASGLTHREEGLSKGEAQS